VVAARLAAYAARNDDCQRACPEVKCDYLQSLLRALAVVPGIDGLP
jgi:hypothetical protein